jgi:non-ribosomal peptide synthetase component F
MIVRREIEWSAQDLMIQKPGEPICISKEIPVAGNADSDLIRDELLHEIFEAAADRYPGQIAIECRNRSLTYGELDQLANRMAHALRARGVGEFFRDWRRAWFACLARAWRRPRR